MPKRGVFMDFEAGDIVMLKSGGPSMTIEKIGPISFNSKTTGAHCSWFENNQLKHEVFSFGSLEKIPGK
jgi:uncharacterized protein YodC (DUF2158 family)